MDFTPMERNAFLTATPAQLEVVRSRLLIVLSILQAQALNYQTSHWQVRGSSAYGNHLLFERLYNSVQGEIDQLAEKVAGYLGSEALNLPERLRLITWYSSNWKHEDLHQRGLESEKWLQNHVKAAYEGIKAADAMTLGLDDFLMALANAHDANQYLLQQVVDGRTAPEVLASWEGRQAQAKTARLTSRAERGEQAEARGHLATWEREIQVAERREATLPYTGPGGKLSLDVESKRFSIYARDLPRRGAEVATGITVRSPQGGLMKFADARPQRKGGDIQSWLLTGSQGHTLIVWNT